MLSAYRSPRFYARPPFDSGGDHVVRCVCLGSVGSPGKENKWLHALQVTPISAMEKEALKVPSSCLDCAGANAYHAVE